MLFSELFNLIKEVKIENGECILNNVKLNICETAFLYYYYIKFEDPELSKSYISEAAKGINTDKLNFHKTAFWLWILGEYINKTSNTEFLDEQFDTIKTACSIIEDCWDKDLPHWLFPEEKGVFLSNISIAYGALLSISNNLKSEYQKLIIDIKKTMFRKFLNGGRIISQPGGTMNGDLSLISVPFALLDAGNQIMVESINTLEKELIKCKLSFNKDTEGRDDLTLLLSWYYVERGELVLARQLLYKVLEAWDEKGFLSMGDKESYFSYILFAITKKSIEGKDFFDNFTQSIMLKHIPCGFQNPYRKENYERLPNHPLEDEDVVLKLVVEPVKDNQIVYAVYKVGDSENRKIMQHIKKAGSEEHYMVSLGSFKYKDIVEYQFIVGEKNEVKSEVYSFEVRKWLPAGQLIKTDQADDYIMLQFDGLKEYSKYINLKIKKDKERVIKFEVSSDTLGLQSKNEKVDRLVFGTFELTADMENQVIHINDFNERELKSINLKNFIELESDGEGIIYKLRYNFDIEESEKFFGMGERFSRVEYRGLAIDNYVYNQYRDQGLKTYIPIPFTISSEGYGIFLDTACYSIFRFDTEKEGVLEIETELEDREQKSDAYLFYGSPKNVISDFIELSGKPAMVPKWSLGPWMSSNNWDSQREVLSQIDLTNKYRIPATVLVIEQWSDEATFYIFNDAQYKVKDGSEALIYEDFKFENWGRWPDPKGMVDYSHDRGIKVLLWQAPVMKYMDGISHAQRDEDERVMLKRGYHVKNRDGKPYRVPYYEWFKGSLIPDFTNTDACNWWMKKRKYLLTDIGIDGFKTDGGECVYSNDTMFENGKTGAEMRNLYPNIYIKAFNDYANSLKAGDSVTFSRAGYTGAQAIPMHWAGDERSTFEAFRASIRAGLSSGMSGIVFWGWDIGGFNGEIPTAELFIRSTEMAAFCPIMQYHAETKGEYNRDRTPWNIAERTNCPEVIEIFRKYANLRMNFLPYIYNEAMMSVNKGIPMMRSMFLQYPNNYSCIDDTTQYFFGEDLLAAPVIYEGERGREVYMPEGSWCGFFTGIETLGGGTLYFNADLGDIPIFIKEDSIIPLNLGENIELCSNVGYGVDAYKNLTFLIYVKDKKTLDFTDDLGNSINISAVRKKGEIDVEIHGNYKEDIHFILRCVESTDRIIINSNVQSGIIRGNEILVKGEIYND